MKKSSYSSKTKFCLDLLFPNMCPCCRKVIKWDKLVCEECESDLPYIGDDDQCTMCGNIHSKNEPCKREFDLICSALKYEGNAVDGIYNLKNFSALNFAEIGGSIICEKLEKLGVIRQIDCVTFIPMTSYKEKLRGYNQAKELALRISKMLEKELRSDLLLREYSESEQHKLSAEERKSTANMVYKQNPEHKELNGKTILLCDDVVTTGATLKACEKILKDMGYDKVICVSICATQLD